MRAMRLSLKSLPGWIWIPEGLGVVLIAAGALLSSYAQGLALAVGVALLLAVPLGLVQHALEERLAVTIERAVSESVAAAESKRLSGPPVPVAPEDLELWPFRAVTEALPGGRIRLRLLSESSVTSSGQPIEVSIVVTDPIERTFNTERKLQSIVSTSVTEWTWPDDFTSGDPRNGEHTADFFVSPLSVGPRRRFGLVASCEFVYPS